MPDPGSPWERDDPGDGLGYLPPSAPRAELGIDGNAGFALLGDDLQVGEAEFEEIPGYLSGPMDAEQRRQAKLAISRAFRRLRDRIGYPISYALHPSHPDYC